jgi:hypothetical protein
MDDMEITENVVWQTGRLAGLGWLTGWPAGCLQSGWLAGWLAVWAGLPRWLGWLTLGWLWLLAGPGRLASWRLAGWLTSQKVHGAEARARFTNYRPILRFSFETKICMARRREHHFASEQESRPPRMCTALRREHCFATSTFFSSKEL